MCSIPTESLIRSGLTPEAICCSAESWRCVVLAGCSTQLLASPTCTISAISAQLSMKILPAAAPLWMPKVSTPLAPLGRYCRLRA